MTVVTLRIAGLADVKAVVRAAAQCKYRIDLVSGHRVADARSVIGIFGLDLSHPVRAEIHSDSCAALLEQLAPYLTEEK